MKTQCSIVAARAYAKNARNIRRREFALSVEKGIDISCHSIARVNHISKWYPCYLKECGLNDCYFSIRILVNSNYISISLNR